MTSIDTPADTLDVPAHSPAPVPVVPGRYRHDWALFTDWCTAADHSPIPAAPETLALFLREHPAALATQRRRLSAINAVHTRHGYPAPGRTEAIRRSLDADRGARLERLGAVLRKAATELPVTGWPAGVFGRRDALLLVLASTGMSAADVTRLRRGDLSVDDGTVVATTGTGERFRLPPDPETGDNPAVGIVLRWAEIQAFLDEHHSTDLLKHHLIDPDEVSGTPLTGRRSRQPLLCPIDRWGHLPYGEPMTPQSVSALVRAYLSDRAPVRKVLPVRSPDDAEVWVEPEIDLDPSYYERGIAARRQAHESLDGLGDVFDEIEDRADAILEELLTVLDGL